MRAKKGYRGKDFIIQMQEFKNRFLTNIRSFGVTVDDGTFEVIICHGYLQMRVEGTNEYGDTVAFDQEICDYGTEIYQHTLCTNPIIEES